MRAQNRRRRGKSSELDVATTGYTRSNSNVFRLLLSTTCLLNRIHRHMCICMVVYFSLTLSFLHLWYLSSFFLPLKYAQIRMCITVARHRPTREKKEGKKKLMSIILSLCHYDKWRKIAKKCGEPFEIAICTKIIHGLAQTSFFFFFFFSIKYNSVK